MKIAYNAILSGADGDYISVCFPDFPGCVTGGEDTTTALQAAKEALEFHVEAMTESANMIPCKFSLQVSPKRLANRLKSSTKRLNTTSM